MIKNLNIIYYLAIACLVCFILWAFGSLTKMVHYDNGVLDTTAKMQKQAISAGVAEFVITDKMSGAVEFRWKTNNPKYLLK